MPVTSLLKPDIKTWLQKSISSELYASNLYKHIANQLQRLGYFGSQKFFLNESASELEHYQKIADYQNDMGDCASVPAIPEITAKIYSIGDALRTAYDTEKALMLQYQDFYEEAEESKDCVTGQFILSFLQIQRESVGEYGDLIAKYEIAERTNEILEFDEHIND